MLAHVRNGIIVKHYPAETGFVQLENGDTVSPPQAGFEAGNDRVVPAVFERQDNSTGTVPTVETDSGWVVEANQVRRTITVRDMTAQEIDDNKTEQANSVSLSTQGKAIKMLLVGLFELANQTHPNAPFTEAQFLNWLDANASKISDATFVAKMKDLLA